MKRGCLAAAMVLLWGCASSPPTHPPAPGVRAFDDVRRVTIIASGESAFTLAEDSAEPGRTFDEILKWHPYGGALRPVAKLVHRAINSLRNVDRVAAATRNVEGISPASVVTGAMARALQESGALEDVRLLEGEPREGRPAEDAALVRVTVPAWGLVRVRQDDAELVSGFADVRGEMVTRGTGVVLWSDSEDVTHPEPAPLASFVRDRDLARDAMVAVLERAGQRLANELLYARSAGR